MAEALQQYWEENFDPEAQKITDLRSVFTAAAPDLVTIMGELGDYFRTDIGADKDRPVQILWRRLELQGKETENLVQMALRRKFLGLDIGWVPLFHHKTDEYGTNFKRQAEIDFEVLDQDDFFLTSRGKIVLASHTLNQQRLSFTDFLAALGEELERLLPTHIVYAGTGLTELLIPMSLYSGGYVVEGVVTTIE
ncbi:MAG: hypothetical protein ABIL58_23265 [Pseudomonadota bacterium]